MGGKHVASRRLNNCRERMVSYYMVVFFVSLQEELLTPLKRSHSAESQLQATTSGSFDSGVAGLSSSSHLTSHSDISQTEGMYYLLLVVGGWGKKRQ